MVTRIATKRLLANPRRTNSAWPSPVSSSQAKFAAVGGTGTSGVGLLQEGQWRRQREEDEPIERHERPERQREHPTVDKDCLGLAAPGRCCVGESPR